MKTYVCTPATHEFIERIICRFPLIIKLSISRAADAAEPESEGRQLPMLRVMLPRPSKKGRGKRKPPGIDYQVSEVKLSAGGRKRGFYAIIFERIGTGRMKIDEMLAAGDGDYRSWQVPRPKGDGPWEVAVTHDESEMEAAINGKPVSHGYTYKAGTEGKELELIFGRNPDPDDDLQSPIGWTIQASVTAGGVEVI